MNNKYNLEIERKIIELFIESVFPLNIQEITDKTKIHRITTRKHLNRLVQRGLIEEVEKPPMRLFRPISITALKESIKAIETTEDK
jgi:predicted ArsR family transcriptional regulator